MKSSIIKIGNSKGIILPQDFLDKCFIKDEVSTEIIGHHIIISASGKKRRQGWEQAFKEMAANGDDQLLIPDMFKDEQLKDDL